MDLRTGTFFDLDPESWYDYVEHEEEKTVTEEVLHEEEKLVVDITEKKVTNWKYGCYKDLD